MDPELLHVLRQGRELKWYQLIVLNILNDADVKLKPGEARACSGLSSLAKLDSDRHPESARALSKSCSSAAPVAEALPLRVTHVIASSPFFLCPIGFTQRPSSHSCP